MNNLTTEELQDLLSYTKHLALEETDPDWKKQYRIEIHELEEIIKERLGKKLEA